MNARPTAHPSDEELRAFGLGKADTAEFETVKAHLETCDVCRKIVERAKEANPTAPPAAGIAGRHLR
jgi:hypothetical protein